MKKQLYLLLVLCLLACLGCQKAEDASVVAKDSPQPETQETIDYTEALSMYDKYGKLMELIDAGRLTAAQEEYFSLWDQYYMEKYPDAYVEEMDADFETVAITTENFWDYFEMVQYEFWDKSNFDGTDRHNIEYSIALKEEYEPVDIYAWMGELGFQYYHEHFQALKVNAEIMEVPEKRSRYFDDLIAPRFPFTRFGELLDDEANPLAGRFDGEAVLYLYRDGISKHEGDYRHDFGLVFAEGTIFVRSREGSREVEHEA